MEAYGISCKFQLQDLKIYITIPYKICGGGMA